MGARDDGPTRPHHQRRDAAAGPVRTPVARALIEDVGERHAVALGIEQGDRDDVGREHLAHLVADEIDHALEVELACEPLLDAVDHGQLGTTPGQLGGLPAPREIGGMGDGRLLGDGREQIAVAGGETARSAVDVGVERAEQLAPGDERRDDARALLGGRRVRRAVTQARPARAPHLVEPGFDRRAQRVGVVAGGQVRRGDRQPVAASEQTEDAPSSDQPGDAVDELAQPQRSARVGRLLAFRTPHGCSWCAATSPSSFGRRSRRSLQAHRSRGEAREGR